MVSALALAAVLAVGGCSTVGDAWDDSWDYVFGDDEPATGTAANPAPGGSGSAPPAASQTAEAQVAAPAGPPPTRGLVADTERPEYTSSRRRPPVTRSALVEEPDSGATSLAAAPSSTPSSTPSSPSPSPAAGRVESAAIAAPPAAPAQPGEVAQPGGTAPAGMPLYPEPTRPEYLAGAPAGAAGVPPGVAPQVAAVPAMPSPVAPWEAPGYLPPSAGMGGTGMPAPAMMAGGGGPMPLIPGAGSGLDETVVVSGSGVSHGGGYAAPAAYPGAAPVEIGGGGARGPVVNTDPSVTVYDDVLAVGPGGGYGAYGIGLIDGQPVAVLQFANGSAALDSRDRQVLAQVAALHRQYGGAVQVVGHASQRTPDMSLSRHQEVNYEVSVRRAEAVASALAGMGVPRGAIHIAAAADSQPVYQEIMPSGEAGNRRAEVYLVR